MDNVAISCVLMGWSVFIVLWVVVSLFTKRLPLVATPDDLSDMKRYLENKLYWLGGALILLIVSWLLV